MAETVGHLALIESSTDGVTYTEIDGHDSFAVNRNRDSIEVTNFKDTTGAKIKIMGLRDGGCDLSGNIVFTVSTLTLDVGIKNIIQRIVDGGALFLQAKIEGAGGTYRGATGLVEEFSLSAEVDGAVKWSAKTCLNGAGWA